MSGGYFDYGYLRISQFADELKREIESNDDNSLDDWGSARGRGMGKETVSRLVVAHQIIVTAGRLAREIEWLYSCDHGEESFNKLFDKIMAGKED